MATSQTLPEWGAPGHPDQVVFKTGLVTVGAFRCTVDHPCFQDSGPIRQPCFVFPRTAVAIEYPDRPAFVADPTVVTLFNAGQPYQRRPLDRDGDRCDWYGLDPDLVREAVRPVDPAAAEDPERPIRRPFLVSPSGLYLRQRRLFAALTSDVVPDALVVEETVCGLFQDVLTAVYGSASGHAPSDATRRQRIATVEAARRALARQFRQPLGLDAIARSVGTSPFQLSRWFRDVLGMTVHRYRGLLRLRAALELIEAGVVLTEVALELGYSSHSHFTQAFRTEFGLPPSRSRLPGRAVRSGVDRRLGSLEHQ